MTWSGRGQGPAGDPSSSVTDDTATYPNVLPGVALKVTADTQGGFSEVLVVKTPEAATNPARRTLTLATITPGQTLSLAFNVAGHSTG